MSESSATKQTSKKAAPKGRKRGRVTDLPPCTICGESASGLHYGVNSCEACKAFFYRNVKRADVLTCEAQGNCKPEAGCGYKCPACRMKKCLQLGMSLTVFKKGRYSYERRANLKKEIASQAAQNTCPDSKNVSQCSSLSPDTTCTSESPATDTSENIAPKADKHLDTQGTEPGTEGTNRLHQIDESVVSSTTSVLQVPTEDHRAVLSPGTCNELTKPLSEEEIISMVRQLSELYNRYPQFPPEYYEKLKIVQQGFLEEMKVKNDVFGKMETLPEQDFLDIYHNTGMDIDGRLEGFKAYYPELEKICLNYVKYVQELPGFDKLGAEDQLSLLKGSKTSYFILGDYMSVDIENEIYTTQNFDTITRDEMGKLFSVKSATKFFSLAGKLKKLNLNPDQINGLRAFLIFNPVCCVTEEGRIQTEIQRAAFFEVLKYLFRDHPSDADLRETIAEMEDEMLQLNHETTIQWTLVMTTYQPIVRESQGEVVEMPIMKKLFGCEK